MLIAMDTRLLGKGGIGTYIAQLSKRLPVAPLSFPAPVYSLSEQLAFPLRIPRCDAFFSPHVNVPLLPIRAACRITTVHDVYHLDHLDQYPLHHRLAVQLLYRRAILGSDLVITVSDFSKRRILHHFPEAQVEVIALGSDRLVGLRPRAVEGIVDRFYLFVGTARPHKNRRLIDGLPLVEADGTFTDRELAWLYRHAEALIFPSLYEGFGLPPIEAMSLGCPVIASRVASIPEICTKAALYFDPKDRRGLERALEELPDKRDFLVEQGRKRASTMTWDRCAQRHLQLLHLYVGSRK